MLHPSYSDLMNVVNSQADESGEHPLIQSRYSIVMATSKRARQLINGEPAFVDDFDKKALSVAVDELYTEKIHIISEDTEELF